MSQEQDATTKLREGTLLALRDFRDQLSTYDNNNLADSLYNNTANIIAVSHTMDNKEQLAGLKNYFSQAQKLIKSSPDSEKAKIIAAINRDISLKLSSTDTATSLNLEPFSSFFTQHDVMVKAFINNVMQVTGNYRLHWFTFWGGDQEAFIKAKMSEGNSQTFTNPYLLKIILPGYISFWMEDTHTQTIYKSDFNYSLMNASVDTIDVYFIPLNAKK